ncbi:MAG TPA: hypothetical protein VK550_05240 [Polyangiaceae bacterium]|jgi:hypothetical protein|nr:hypothetical protein [Polyangiaceae bacterium]
MSNEQCSQSEIPARIPLRLAFHYEVDERGEKYRVWEEQLREPVGIGGDLDHLQRHVHP